MKLTIWKKYNFILFWASLFALAGLIDSCVEQMKQTQSQLHLESVRPGKASYRKKVSRDCLEISSLSYSVLPLFFSIGIMSDFSDKYYEHQL